MIRPQWLAKRWLRRRSILGFVGLVLLASSLLFDLAMLGPAHARLEQLRQEILLADTKANQPTYVQPDRETLAEQQLSDYYRHFPLQNSAPDWLSKIFQAAKAETIQLVQGEYRVQQSENGKLIHYHVTMPVKGTYTQIRHFIATVLANVPMASLDHVSFERHKIEDPEIEAKVTFTLYMVAS